MTKTKPPDLVLVVTVCRRYHELAANLAAAQGMAEAEFGRRLPCVIVWARPEIGRLHLMRKLLAEGLCSRVLGRPAVEGEGDGLATTVPESRSIRESLLLASSLWPAAAAAVMAADIRLQPGTLSFIRDHIAQGNDACCFHWVGGVREGAWHTNLFGVRLSVPECWPPVAKPGEQDVLERMWGLSLERAGRPFKRWHNSGEKRFLHRHESESLPAFPLASEGTEASVPLFLSGPRPSVLRRVFAFLCSLIPQSWKRA